MALQQPRFFDLPDPPIPAIAAPAPEQPRLRGQNARILARLQAGPASNRELAALSLKYTARLSDLRAAGYDVRVVTRDHHTGHVVYALQEGKR